MALYPTPAGHRMALDRDGTAGFAQGPGNGTDTNILGGSGTHFTGYTAVDAASMTTGNDENVASLFLGWARNQGSVLWGYVFPELRDLTGYYIDMDASSALGAMETSTNTTTGVDGVWTTLQNPFTDIRSDSPDGYRSHITVVSASAIKGVRFHSGTNFANGFGVFSGHLYGQPSAGQNPDSLRIWQPVTNAEVTTVFDFGDIPRGTSATQTFRVKNLSGTKTGTSITVSAEALTDASPSLLGQFLFSTDNITFTSSINIGNLAPGAVSAVLYVRNNVDAGAALSVWALRMVATPASFA